MSDGPVEESSKGQTLQMAVSVVAAYLAKNPVQTDQLSSLLHTVHASLRQLGSGAGEPVGARKPAVPIKKSVSAEHITCLEDGLRMKMLKRHLRTAHQLTPDQYRAKWALGPDYPIVAPNYALQRSAFAKKIGLGRKRGPNPAPRGRKGRRAGR